MHLHKPFKVTNITERVQSPVCDLPMLVKITAIRTVQIVIAQVGQIIEGEYVHCIYVCKEYIYMIGIHQ